MTARERAAPYIYVNRAKDVESGGAYGGATQLVDGVGAVQSVGARRNCDYFRKWTDTSMISSIVLGSTSSLLNVVLGAIHPAHLVIVRISQIVLGLAGLSATVIMTLSNQLELDSDAINHS
jgi:hypothetical protein